MNIVYTVTLSTEITVKMAYGSSRVIDMKSGQELAISAGCSHFYNAPSGECDELAASKGLSFRWDCTREDDTPSAALTSYCDKWKGSSQIVIPSNFISQNRLVNKPVTVKVIVTSIEASE